MVILITCLPLDHVFAAPPCHVTVIFITRNGIEMPGLLSHLDTR